MHPGLGLTIRGAEIANAVFGAKEIGISEEMQDRYIKRLIAKSVEEHSLRIFPKVEGRRTTFRVLLLKDPLELGVDKEIPQVSGVSDPVYGLLKWAGENYSCRLVPN